MAFRSPPVGDVSFGFVDPSHASISISAVQTPDRLPRPSASADLDIWGGIIALSLFLFGAVCVYQDTLFHRVSRYIRLISIRASFCLRTRFFS